MAEDISSNANDWYPDCPLDSAKKEIRVLVLQPAINLAQTVRVDVRTVQLGDENLNYEPLSYVWGGYEKRRKIVMRGRPGFKVTDNLYLALRRLRHKVSARILWVDALCINQSDIEERNKQLLLMSTIYSRGRRTLVWLGETESQKTKILASFHYRYGHRLKAEDAWARYSTTDDVWPAAFGYYFGYNYRDTHNLRETASISVLIGYRIAQLRDIFKLIRRRKTRKLLQVMHGAQPFWASRAWVYQEAAVSKHITVVCGPESLAWDSLHDIAQSLFPIRSTNTVAANVGLNLIHDLREAYGNGGPISAVSLLRDTRSSQCKLAHDKVYSLLALMLPTVAEGCQPDYDRPEAVAYAKFTSASIKQEKNLDLLQLVRPNRQRNILGPDSSVDELLPSWAVDFEVLPTIAYPWNMLFESSILWWKQNPSPQHNATCSDGKTLVLDGSYHDKLHDTFFLGRYGPETEADLQLWDTIIKGAFRRARGANLLAVFGLDALETDLGNLVPDHEVVGREEWPPEDQNHLTWQPPFQAWLVFGQLEARWNAEFGFALPPQDHLYVEQFAGWVTRDGKSLLRFVTTDRGLIGLAFESVADGDEIVYLDGARLPAVLRKVPSSDTYTFQGFIYVTGCLEYCDAPRSDGSGRTFKMIQLRFPTDHEANRRTYTLV